MAHGKRDLSDEPYWLDRNPWSPHIESKPRRAFTPRNEDLENDEGDRGERNGEPATLDRLFR